MKLPAPLDRILQNALDRKAPSKEECVYLLTLPADSLEAGVLRSVGDTVSRRRFGNEAMLLGQIGTDTAPCPGNCKFCVFGEDHTQFERTQLTVEEIVGRAKAFSAGGDLYAIFLMTMHDFEWGGLLSAVEAVRREIPAHTQIVVNIGDFTVDQARELRASGVQGAYHVCRLREGVDTGLDPEARKETFRVIREAGLDFYYCCEPIGPEHSPQELVEQMFLGIEHGCFQHAAMRRVWVPQLPVAERGQITELRLAQVVAVVSLATLGCPETQNIAVHEPNLVGLTAGANVVYAETGANPRDTEADTARNRGLDMEAARKMLYEAGFSALRLGDGKTVSLDLEYLQDTNRCHLD
ncbi:MAG: radical SAM protein [Candidatus Nealsonbacteria bacterium]|nr:radical SAM protein [Candidatus Nealsonbacteria bacterium]